MILNKPLLKKIFLVLILLAVAVIIGLYVAIRTNKITGTAELRWNKNNEADMAGYKIYYGTEPRRSNTPENSEYASQVDTGMNNYHLFTNLSLFKTYYFSITAYNKSGKESAFSDEVNKKITIKSFFRR